MFGLFSKPKCPVEGTTKKWIEDAMLWFRDHPSVKDLHDIPFLLPTIENFGNADENSEEMAWRFAKKLGEFLKLDPGKFNLTFIDPDFAEMPEGFRLQKFENVTYPVYSQRDPLTKIFTVYIEKPELQNGEVFLASLLYQLLFLKLKSENFCTDPSGHLTSLYSVVAGTGVLSANGIVNYKKWNGVSYSGWRISSRGYLSQSIYGYALALLADFREEESPEWSRFLCRDVKAYFERSVRYIDSTKDKISFLLNNSKAILSPLPPDYRYTSVTHYDDGMIYMESEMKNSLRDGITKFFYRNGNLWTEWVYKDNRPFTVLSNYDPKGNKLEKGTLKEGNGTLYLYRTGNALEKIQYFKNGDLTREDLFSDEGILVQTTTIENGKMNGLTTFYHGDGSLWAEWLYKSNSPFTVISNYDTKGNKREAGTLKEGSGTLYSYDADDRLNYVEYYENGKLLRREKE
jgi:antitoxin component YwqK of YwqJK toxin-antitoxin module